MASTRIQTVSLSKDETNLLLKTYSTSVLDALLTAFAQTLEDWTKSASVLFILIINGREAIFEDVDLSRTVGHFALGHPTLVDLTHAQTSAAKFATVKEQLARIPNRGITHGILHLNERPEVKRKVKKLDDDAYQRKVVFNYIPPAKGTSAGIAFQPVQNPIDLTEDPQNKRDYILKCTASFFQEQLVFAWEYSTNLHRPETIQAVTQYYMAALRALIALEA